MTLLNSITQVVDLLEGLRCSQLPVLCERIIEVPVREWLVAPALTKDGQYWIKKAPVLDEDLQQEGDTSHETDGGDFNEHTQTTVNINAFVQSHFSFSVIISEGPTTEEDAEPAFGSVPYIARPHPVQMGHTGQMLLHV